MQREALRCSCVGAAGAGAGGEAGEPQGPAPEDLLGGTEFEFYSKSHLRV